MHRSSKTGGATLGIILVVILVSSCRAPQVAEAPSVTEGAAATPALLDREFRVYSQNSFLLPGVGVLVSHRVPCIAQLVAGYDIVALQEVFEDEAQDSLVKGWLQQKNLPAGSIDLSLGILSQKQAVGAGSQPNGDGAQVVSHTYFVLGPDRSNIKQDGGLLILSRFPILEAAGFTYTECDGSDCWSNKGALYARIQVGDGPEDYIHVFNTHTQSGESQENRRTRASQFAELREFMDLMLFDDGWIGPEVVVYPYHPMLLLGDLNVDAWFQPGEYNSMLQALPPLEDQWLKFHKTDNQSWQEGANYNPGFTWVGRDHEVVTGAYREVSGTPSTYIDHTWGGFGNKLAQDDGDPARLDYTLAYGAEEEYQLLATAMTRIPEGPLQDPYCFQDEPAKRVGVITGDLKQAIIDQLPSGVNSIFIEQLGEARLRQLADLLGESGFSFHPEATLRRDGYDLKLDNLDPARHYVLRYEVLRQPGEDWTTYKEADLVIYRYGDAPTECRRVSQVAMCGYPDRYPTVSDHLGLAIDLTFRYPPSEISEVEPAIAATIPVQASPTSPSSPSPRAQGITALMRAVNARQAAIATPEDDWGLGGAPDSGASYPADDALTGASDADLSFYVGRLRAAVNSLLASRRFWNERAQMPYTTLADLLGQDSWPSGLDDEKALGELASVVLKLDTVLFTSLDAPSLARYPAPDGVYPTAPDAVAQWDIEGLWQGMVANVPLAETRRGLAISRHVDHVHPYAWLLRTFLGFDTTSLAAAPPVEEAWLLLAQETAYTWHYNYDDPTDPVLPTFSVQAYAGWWDPVAQTGDGWGVGPAAWAYVEGAAQQSWDSCPALASTFPPAATTGQGVIETEIDPSVVSSNAQTQIKLRLADESFPGAPGVRYVYEEMFQLTANPADHLLLARLAFRPLPDWLASSAPQP